MDMDFCRRCGTPLETISGHVYRCQNGHTIYANASPTVAIFIVTPENDVLLAVRGIEPWKGSLDTFGGFLDGAESFEDAAARELQEELGLERHHYEPLNYLASGSGKYPFAGEAPAIVTVSFWTRLVGEPSLTPSDDVAAIKRIPISALRTEDFHNEDIRIGARKLQELFPGPEGQQ